LEGGQAQQAVGVQAPGAPPPTIISAVAITGSAAVELGNGVDSSYSTPTAIRAARPTQASRPTPGRRSQHAPVRIRNAPSAAGPSSEARVGREKHVHGCEISIQTTQAMKEARVSTATAYSRRRSLRRTSQKPSVSSAGQNR